VIECSHRVYSSDPLGRYVITSTFFKFFNVYLKTQRSEFLPFCRVSFVFSNYGNNTDQRVVETKIYISG